LPTSTGNNPCCSINGTIIHDEELPLIKQLAAEKSLPIVDLNTPTAGHPEYFGDGVHPTDAGYLVVAKLVHDGLLQDLSPIGADAGTDGAADGGGSTGDGGAIDATDTAVGGTGGSAGTGGAGVMAGSGGAGGSAVEPGIADGGRSDGANADSGQIGGGGGGGAGPSGSGASSGGCSVSGSGDRGLLASVLALSVLLLLMGLRRRSGRRGQSC
jgi:hypothetical protein